MAGCFQRQECPQIVHLHLLQWWIQDFQGRDANPQRHENCAKMKTFRLGGGGGGKEGWRPP